jgi:hypothetical protein
LKFKKNVSEEKLTNTEYKTFDKKNYGKTRFKRENGLNEETMTM